jgi:hypothetical protein
MAAGNPRGFITFVTPYIKMLLARFSAEPVTHFGCAGTRNQLSAIKPEGDPSEEGEGHAPLIKLVSDDDTWKGDLVHKDS